MTAGYLEQVPGVLGEEEVDDEYVINLPRPLSYQQVTLDDDHRYKALRWGRRRGKSRLALLAAVNGHGPRDAQNRPKFPGLVDGAHGLWIVPEFPQARAIWDEEIRPRFAGKRYCQLLQTTRTLRVGNGQLSLASAAAIDSKRGSKQDFAVIDEAAFMNFAYVWNAVIRPALADRMGWAIIISTTKTGSDFNRLITDIELGKANDPPDPRWEDWMTERGYTRDNPKLSPSEIASLYAEYPPGSTDVLQELEAELVEAHGTLFKQEYFHNYEHADRTHMMVGTRRLPFHDILLTVDLATGKKQTGDYVVGQVSGIHRANNGVKKVGVLHVEWAQVEGPEQIDMLERLIRFWQPTRTKIESTQYQITAVQHLLRRMPGAIIQPFYPDTDKRTRALPWAAAMARGDVFWPAHAGWMQTTKAQYQRFPNGKENSRYIEDHDDIVDVGSAVGDELQQEAGNWASTRR